MVTDAGQLLDPPISGTTEDEREAGEMPASEVIERVNEILGYDIFEVQLMAEGYLEFAAESISLSESNLAAAEETLPPE